MKIVDPHIHLWDTHRVHYPWLAKPTDAYSGDNRLLPKLYDAAAFLSDTQDIQVLATVNIEANPADPEAEVRWLRTQSHSPASHRHPTAIVAYADLSRADAAQRLQRLSMIKSVKGIRQVLNIHPNPRYNYALQDFLAQPKWRENIALLSQYGWSFDLQLYPSQVDSAAQVIQANPDIQFIINHSGMFVDRTTTRGWREWRAGLRTLALVDNTAIKLSGLAMFDHRWTIDSFRPLVLEAIDCFGTDRSMFASNFPIDRLHTSYPALWRTYAQIVFGMTVDERESLFINNAVRYYRLPPIPQAAA
jgi:predicted TIM-barrel fold metal-dependent hydrolase